MYYTAPPYSHELGANWPPSNFAYKEINAHRNYNLSTWICSWIYYRNLLYHFTSLLLLAAVYYRTKSLILCEKKKCMVFE